MEYVQFGRAGLMVSRLGLGRRGELDPRQLLTTFGTSTPQLNFVLDRDKAKQLGLNLTDVFTTMQTYLGSLYINDFNLFGRTFVIGVQVLARRCAFSNARGQVSGRQRILVRE